MDIFLQIIKDTAPDTSLEDIQKPIRDIGIDSIDLVVIRVELEKYYGRIISDKEWFSFTTLEQVYSCFATKNATVNIEVVIAHKTIEIVKNIEITMPQMANSALSENWLLKDLGDAHWKSLSDGLETKSAELKDQDGNRLYATFTRISYTCSPIGNFKENEILEFKGSIKRFGNSVYISKIDGVCRDSFITATLMTSFSIRTANDNSKIEKSKPKEKINHIEEIKSTPDFLNDYRLVRKNLIDSWDVQNFQFSLRQDAIFVNQYYINPYYDINGVGLLYFAAYPVIADISLDKFFKEELGNNDWIEHYQTVYRDINYFANCNANETSIVTLDSYEIIDEKRIITTASLSRSFDEVLLARIFTVKEKNSF